MLKAVSSITNAIGALNYKGTWNAGTNSPALVSSAGTKGDYYVVGTAGSTALDGLSNWGVGDWAVFNGSTWQRVEGGADGNFVNLTSTGVTTLAGTTTNDSASAGVIGEYVTATKTVDPGVALTNGAASNITSITLTAGDWDVWGRVGVYNATAATWTYLYGVISLTSGSFGTEEYAVHKPDGALAALANFQFSVPQQRISLASTTTIYLVCSPGFSGGSGVIGFGSISARRAR